LRSRRRHLLYPEIAAAIVLQRQVFKGIAGKGERGLSGRVGHRIEEQASFLLSH
jgi:hypothetical protein